MSNQLKPILSVIGGLIVGGLIGASVMLLAAPKSGVETRQQIRSKSLELKDKAISSYNDSRIKVNEAVSRVRSQASELAHKATRRQEAVTQIDDTEMAAV
jgi:gas vesicle protein